MANDPTIYHILVCLLAACFIVICAFGLMCLIDKVANRL